MLKLGFRASWVDIVIRCVESPMFLFVINGVSSAFAVTSEGLHPGPYFLIFASFCDIGPHWIFTKSENCWDYSGHSVC